MSHVRMPGGLPGGLLAIIVGAAIAWLMKLSGIHGYFDPDWSKGIEVSLHLPIPVIDSIFSLITSEYVWRYMSVIIPMGLFNVVGSLQNLESAEAAGDKFDTKSSLLANGLGSVLASFLGSCFPHHHIYWSSWLEGAWCTYRIFHYEWHIHPRNLPYRDNGCRSENNTY